MTHWACVCVCVWTACLGLCCSEYCRWRSLSTSSMEICCVLQQFCSYRQRHVTSCRVCERESLCVCARLLWKSGHMTQWLTVHRKCKRFLLMDRVVKGTEGWGRKWNIKFLRAVQTDGQLCDDEIQKTQTHMGCKILFYWSLARDVTPCLIFC